MKFYIFAFIFVLIASSAMVNMDAPAFMPSCIADIKPVSHGLIRPEAGIGDLHITEAARSWRYTTEITTKHPARESDFPFFGNN
jgi:hypothetical protein